MDKAKKKLLKRYMTWAAIAGVVLLLTVMPLLAKSEAEADGPVASILSAQVEVQDIPQTLRGGGTLEALGEADVNIPAGVKITEFLVKNGDTVQEGDPVARVDKVSVMAAAMEVSETMKYLQKELEKGREEQIPSTVYATPGGRVKRIFVWPGDDVQDVMLNHDCLALLSIDGLMAVKLDVDAPVTTGESVNLTLSDGSQVTGRVESNLNHQVIVTVEDEGYAIGETVTVSQMDGTQIGKGELYVHNAWKATAYSGTISAVNVQEEQVLSEGAAMFTLTDRDYAGQRNRRASQHREYEALLQRLMAMYESGCITAPCTGTVSGVDEDSVHLLSAQEGQAQVTLLDGADMGSVRLMLLSSVSCTGDPLVPDCQADTHADGCPKFCDRTASCPAAQFHNSDCPGRCTLDKNCPAENHKQACITRCHKAAGEKDPCDAITHYDECIKSCKRASEEGKCKDGKYPHYPDCIESCTEGTPVADCEATGAHKLTCIRSCTRATALNQCPATGSHYYNCIESCKENNNCLSSVHKDQCPLKNMTFTAQLAKVDYIGNTVLGVYWDENVYPVSQGANGWQLLSQDYTGQTFLTKGELAVDNPGSYTKGDVVMVVTGYKDGQQDWTRTVKYTSAGGSQSAAMESMGTSVMAGNFAGYGNFSDYTVQTENLFDLKGSTLMTVTAEEGYGVEISLDERDIHKVQVGQEATIRLEAVRGELFSGTVTRVGAIGTHSGGSGKFQVRVETGSIPGSLPGMSAMVRIHLDTKQDVLTLPVAAISQDGAKTIVYTALDENGEPTAPKEITTGASDGETVEVLGLDEGTKVYYAYYDVLEIDDSAEAQKFTMY